MLEKSFILAGKAIFTLEMPESFAATNDLPNHYTYRINKKEANDRWPETYFVSLLTGPDNTADYTYMGMLNADLGQVRLTKASAYKNDSWPYRLLSRIMQRLWAGEADKIAEAGFNLHHEGRCCRCGRALTVPESITSGIGPECAKKL